MDSSRWAEKISSPPPTPGIHEGAGPREKWTCGKGTPVPLGGGGPSPNPIALPIGEDRELARKSRQNEPDRASRGLQALFILTASKSCRSSFATIRHTSASEEPCALWLQVLTGGRKRLPSSLGE